MTAPSRQSTAFFEARYGVSMDPWQFATSPYELNRYAVTLAALSRPAYRRAFEPGCSIGVFTAALASRVGHLSACDLSQTAVASATERCHQYRHIEIYQGDVRAVATGDMFDLIVFLLHGDEVHQVLAQSFPGAWLSGTRHPEFRIDSWSRT
jgi:protein-L-isoaspartate O-methyltransferase